MSSFNLELIFCSLTLILFCELVLAQLPRLYNVYKNMGIVTSFQNILDNVFIPLFEVAVDPNSHPQLHLFLKQVSQFFSLFFLCVNTYPYFCVLVYVFPGVAVILCQQ